jgi:hypothetical protein
MQALWRCTVASLSSPNFKSTGQDRWLAFARRSPSASVGIGRGSWSGWRRQGFDLQLHPPRRTGWRATFNTTVMSTRPRAQRARARRAMRFDGQNMAKSRPEEKREPEPATGRVLPMQLQIGDRLSDETGEYEVIGRPYTTAAGKTAHVRVKRVGSEAAMVRVWGAHERVSVRRTGGA